MDTDPNSEIYDAQVVAPPIAQPTGVQLTLGFFPLAFLFFFCTPVAVFNGVAYQLGWGTHYVDLPPGRYMVKIYIPYLAWPECGANAITLELRPGEVRNVRFYMWPWVFAPGSISVT